MIDDIYIELMNREIDGVNTPEESHELKQYLETHPEARSHYDQLLQLESIFERTKKLAPPQQLRDKILSLLFEKEEKSRIVGVKALLEDRRNRRIFYIFASGIVTGLILFAIATLFTPEMKKPDFEHMYGTLTLIENEKAIFTTEAITFEGAEASGWVRVKYTSERILVDLKIASDSQVDVTLTHDPRIRFEGSSIAGSADYSVQITYDEMKLIHSGDQEYVFLFSDEDKIHAPIDIAIVSDGKRLFERRAQPESS